MAFKHMAMWTWPESVLNEEPQRMMERLKAAHIDIIIPYTCPQRGKEGGQPRAYFDRLRGIIEEAHRAGLQVQACFDEVNAYPEMPVYGLRQVRQDGSVGNVLCHANPAVMDYVLDKLHRILVDFDYDGINLEDGYIFNNSTIYDPAHRTGEKFQVVPVCYCDHCRKHAPIEKPEWAIWKRERLTDLIRKESELIRRLKPGMPFSVAARMPYDRSFYDQYREEVPYYDGWQICQSRGSFSADWAEWLRRGHLDFACPMSYFHSNRLVELETLESRQLIPDAGKKIWMGLGLGECTAEYLQEKKDETLRNGAEAVESLLRDQLRMGQENVVFFCYQYLLDEHLPVLADLR